MNSPGYVLAGLRPAGIIAGLAAEVVVFRLVNRGLSWFRIVALVLVINIVSTVAGIALAQVLPSGLEIVGGKEAADSVADLSPGPNFMRFAVLGFVVAFVLSILIEWAGVLVLRRLARVTKPFLTVGLANVASYAALIAVAWWWSLLFSW